MASEALCLATLRKHSDEFPVLKESTVDFSQLWKEKMRPVSPSQPERAQARGSVRSVASKQVGTPLAGAPEGLSVALGHPVTVARLSRRAFFLTVCRPASDDIKVGYHGCGAIAAA